MNLKSILVAAGMLLFAGWMAMTFMDSRSVVAAQQDALRKYRHTIARLSDHVSRSDQAVNAADQPARQSDQHQELNPFEASAPIASTLPQRTQGRRAIQDPFATTTRPVMPNTNVTTHGFQQGQFGPAVDYSNPNISWRNAGQNLWPMGTNHVFELSLENATDKIRDAVEKEDREKAIEEAKAFLENEYDRHLSTAQKKIDVLNERLSSLNAQMDKRRDAKDRLVNLKLEMIINNADGIGWPNESGPSFFRTNNNVRGGMDPARFSQPLNPRNRPARTPDVSPVINRQSNSVRNQGTVTQISKSTDTIKFRHQGDQNVARDTPVIVRRGNAIVGQGRVIQSRGEFSVARLSSGHSNQVQVADQVSTINRDRSPERAASNTQDRSVNVSAAEQPESGLPINPFLINAIKALEQEKFEEFLFQFTPSGWLRQSLNKSRLDTLVQNLQDPDEGPNHKDLLAALKVARASRLIDNQAGMVIVKPGNSSHLQPDKRFVYKNDDEYKVEVWHQPKTKRLSVSFTFYNEDGTVSKRFFHNEKAVN